MVVRQDGPRFLDWSISNDRPQTKAATVKIGFLDVVDVVEAAFAALQFWQHPPRCVSRPFERPCATGFGDSVGQHNEGLDKPSAALSFLLHLGAESRA